MKEKRIGILDCVLLALPALFLAGILTLFQPCSPSEDGGWMNCHWAGQALMALAAALLVLGVLRLFLRPSVRIGMDISAMVLCAAAFCVPGRLIPLCLMPQMRCRAVMAPWVTVLSVLIIVAAAADIVLKKRKQNHEL